jgi:hypothetical protein
MEPKLGKYGVIAKYKYGVRLLAASFNVFLTPELTRQGEMPR